jgi:RNA polymerase sigma-70 factor (ECF subfamily)
MLAFQGGDDEAFRRLLEAFQASVFRFLVGRVGDAGRAEDLTQEVFLRVFRARDKYRPTASFRGWLFTIAHRLALNELRSRRRRFRIFARRLPSASLSTESSAEPSADEFWSQIPDPKGRPPEEAAETAEVEHRIGELMDRLPPNQRVALELVAAEGLSYAEAAAVLGTTVSAVRSLLVRAREALRRGLSRTEPSEGTADPQEDEG